jgi:predicted urease superfamily metal-dependent hydrolase
MKTETETIREVRQVRSRIAAAHGHDPKRLVQHYIEMQMKKVQQVNAGERAKTRR